MSRPCCDFMQHHLDSSFDVVIPRASTHSAANSGSSTPSTHTEIGNAVYIQTNGNSVGRLNPRRLSSFPPLVSFYQMLLFCCCCACRPLSSCCIHSNFFYRLTMNHFFVWIFFLTLWSSLPQGLSCSVCWLDSAHFLSLKCRKYVGEKGLIWGSLSLFGLLVGIFLYFSALKMYFLSLVTFKVTLKRFYQSGKLESVWINKY